MKRCSTASSPPPTHPQHTCNIHLPMCCSAGTKLAIVGPNGAGKSTLLKILGKKAQHDSGLISRKEVCFGGAAALGGGGLHCEGGKGAYCCTLLKLPPRCWVVLLPWREHTVFDNKESLTLPNCVCSCHAAVAGCPCGLPPSE
jgi:hypothetical protein